MCRTCGCGAGHTIQLELQVRDGDGRTGLQFLHDRLMGSPGILQVNVDEGSGKVLADFNPQRTSRQEVEDVVAEAGYAVVNSQIREMDHQHGITAFLKRIVGK